MELPRAVQGIVDGLLEETSLSTLSDAADVLSRRYRGEVRDGLGDALGDPQEVAEIWHRWMLETNGDEDLGIEDEPAG